MTTSRTIRLTKIDERYAKLVEQLTKVKDVETKTHVINLIENGFTPFDLTALGQPRNRKNSLEDQTA